MKSIDKAYIRFSQMIEDGYCNNEGETFISMCRSIGVAPAALEERIWDELGMGGEELLAGLRAHNRA